LHVATSPMHARAFAICSGCIPFCMWHSAANNFSSLVHHCDGVAGQVWCAAKET
jgi:hypothetical protein